jgi:hypothetical protein
MTSPAPLLDSLRELCSIALRAGADSEWVRETAEGIVNVLLAQRYDPRRRRSRAQAAHMAITVRMMERAGHTHGQAVEALCRRHGLRRSWVYELLKLSGDFTGQNKR